MATKTYRWVHEHRDSVASFFEEKWTEAEESKKFFRMLQYSDSQLKTMEKDSRVPYVLDFITQPINTFMGDQRNNRTDIKYLPVEYDDDLRAEVLNAVKSAVLLMNRWLWLLSDLFQDGIIEKMGAIGYEWSTLKDPMGRLDMFRVPARQLTWDTHRRDYDLNESSWVSRSRLYRKRDLMRKYPQHAKFIEGMSFNESDLGDLRLDSSYWKQIYDTELDAVALIEFFERDYKLRYFLALGSNIREGYFEKKEDAEKMARDLTARTQGMNPDVPAPELSVIPRYMPVVLKSEIAHNMDFVSQEVQKEPFYPFDAFYPFWEDGEYWGIIDLYKDPQRFINKMFSMIDNQINKGSKGLLLVDDSVPTPIFDKMVSTWNATGGAMKFPDPKNNVTYIKPDSFDPRLLDSVNLAIANIERKAGGRNFTGGRETAQESGVAVEKRVQRAGVASFSIFDNLDRFQLFVGEKIAWYITHYMTVPQKVRIMGDELTRLAEQNLPDFFTPSIQPGIGFITVNTRPINTLENLTVDTIIDQSAHAVSKNQETLFMIQQMMQSSPNLAETMPPQMLIALFDLPYSVKQKMMQAAEELQQARLEMQKAEANKPPTLSANLKDVTVLPAEVQSQFLALFGLGPTGELIEDPKVRAEGQRSALTMLMQSQDLMLKKEKADDQAALKMAGMRDKYELGKEANAIAREKAKGNGDAKKVRSDKG